MKTEIFEALGLNRRFLWEAPINGHSTEGFGAFLSPPEDAKYTPCQEANPAHDIQRGSVSKIDSWADSTIYPGTRRDIWVYQSAQLAEFNNEPDLIVFQDGGGYVDQSGPIQAPAVIDSLVHEGILNPTIAVFVNPGQIEGEESQAMLQRSLEYDTVDNTYASFLLQDIIPLAEGAAGRTVTRDPSRRTIIGISSGGICAFTAAWFHPESFGRVLSHCGSFVNIEGGHNYPYLIRTNERKPIRVFLTSGENDLDIPLGSWPLANHAMADALTYSGYDFRFEFSDGGHSLCHGGSIFAESLRWLHA